MRRWKLSLFGAVRRSTIICWPYSWFRRFHSGFSMVFRDRPTPPRSPWQNGYAERLIGSIRRECIDHVIVFGERHLRHLLRSYFAYYNETRTHLGTSIYSDFECPVSARAARSAFFDGVGCSSAYASA